MPRPGKPKALIVRHETAAETGARSAREDAMRPARGLPLTPPARLREHPAAAAAWRRVMRTYAELEGEIVTRLDLDLLVDYCLLIEQVSELDEMRRAARKTWIELEQEHQRALDQGDADRALMLATKAVGVSDAVVKLDGRVDRKRDLVFKFRQSLYLTPRARAGVAPAGKPAEEAVDPLDALLDDVTNFINGPGQ